MAILDMSGDLKEELIRDRLVDAALSEKLQMDPGQTLEKAVTSARQKEAVRKQQPLMQRRPNSLVKTLYPMWM